MLKIATVFSGIGAIEHAIERLEIENKVIFACDNGGVNIFKLKIEKDLQSVEKHVKLLSKMINELEGKPYVDKGTEQKLKENFLGIQKEYNRLDFLLEQFSGGVNTKIRGFISTFLDLADEIKLPKILLQYKGKEVPKNMEYFMLEEIRKLYKEVKSSNKNFEVNENVKGVIKGAISLSVEEFSELFSFMDEKESKEIKSIIAELIQQINMLNERICSVKITYELSQIEDYAEKKAYVDNLYKNKEKSNFVKQSYTSNYGIDDKDFHWNISFLDGRCYRDQVDLFVGGSPCQSFSLVGKRRGLEDTRGTLFYDFARLIDEIQPKVFIYENVKGLLDHDEGKTWEVMQEVFEELNYDCHYDTLNAKDYGIPQNRERIFVVGFRKDLMLKSKFKFPGKISLDNRTMKDLLFENVLEQYYLNEKGITFVSSEKNINKRYTQIDGKIQLCQKANQQFNWHGDFVFVESDENTAVNDSNKVIRYTLPNGQKAYIRKNDKKGKDIEKELEKYFLSDKVRDYVMASGTKDFYSKPEIDLDIARPLLTTMHKMHRAGIDNYVTTEGRIRKLTPRECLRLMGFCDTFKIVVSDTQMYQQAGNSIVVDVLMAIMKEILIAFPELGNEKECSYKETDAEQLALFL
ncbi:DNA cytosine methyltransferase [Bacillus cereus group sp. MYBK163-2]|uniref:DNA (cytosine-5-)-methyltransferase n=1 Tax=Bacillus thuringiensis serovar iberica TaxID=180866 RepID=A0A9X6QSW2_BACTU|nr:MULTISPECIES: DNA cytosine methyltransferase [Bacillus cereus group]HDR5352311.1 DNA cytosine methyltransferase [Bacillus thuringiensis]MCU5644589.1 DNA cytosine methyltransferase [Bacillus cereus]MDA2432633.1 DNA cytosine methyltransferase [Bacillus cereus]MDZ4602507.1 DNA cytosine methyltransferase [Bacillus cereus]MEB9623481.1 DNA cytosine methyltransferase [Bacillus cereus]